MAMTFAALLKWLGGHTPPPGTLKPALLGVLSQSWRRVCMFVRGQVSGAVVQGLCLCKVNECTGEAVSTRAFPVAAWTLALVWCVASSCGCPCWRGNPWPPGRMEGCWLALKPRATKMQNEFLQPGLGRRARDRVPGLRAPLPKAHAKGHGAREGRGQSGDFTAFLPLGCSVME